MPYAFGPKSELSEQQLRAMWLGRKAARRIAGEYPEIAGDYRNCLTLEGIVERYGFAEKYGLSTMVAKTAVYYALRQLIPKREFQRISLGHLRFSGERRGRLNYERREGFFTLSREQLSRKSRKTGKRFYRQGIGIFSLTPEEKLEIASKAGKAGGRKTYEEGKGIFSLTSRELEEAGRKGALASGSMPWSRKEKKYLIRLSGNPEYCHKKARFAR